MVGTLRFARYEAAGISMPSLIVDGMLSGTGIRNADAGGYLDPKEVGLSSELVARVERWRLEYENAHYHQFSDNAENERLDREGIAIARQVQEQLPGTQVEYFSNAEMRRQPVGRTGQA